ncbi:uncharacterized protein LOC122327406 [Puntigrus tetrazona]|uniref:uncharacterized protein LOC122327406 n=1 Tax=Puntigrus tetrazona TaxID=1606681 RepID=UPI001C8A32EE|nr:uncharacterized protein LOC122327406 [Puntigrus tetrazona]
MRNHSLLFWVLLFVDGVFGSDETFVSVSVMKGDTVTLHTYVSELQSDDIIEWMSKDGVFIAKIENKKISEKYVPEKRFQGRLELDPKTGSLTIRNITAEHDGNYKLDIRGQQLISKNFSVTVHDDVESVSVTEGDSVTLHTNVKVQRDDQLFWKFEDQDIPIDRLNSAGDSGWSNAHLSNKTGDLTIKTIQMKQSGVYKVEITTIGMILHRKFKMTVDGVKNVSVKKGDSVTLRTGVIDIQSYDLILWKFENHLIAEINKETNKFLLYDSSDKRFKDRLQPNEKTGSLTISDSETTDSGVYHLNMSCSTYTLQRTISVTVKGLSVTDIILISVSTALVIAVVLAIYLYCSSRQRRDRVL